MQIDSIEFGCTKSKLEDYMTGSQEVVGSSPIFSTSTNKGSQTFVL